MSLKKRLDFLSKIRWRHVTFFVVAVIAVAVIAAVVLYVNVSARISNGQTYVSGWSQLMALASGSDTFSLQDSSSGISMVSGTATDVEGRNYPIISEDQINKNIENILIIGIDKGKEDTTSGHRSDTMIVVSINSKDNTVKLTSIMRDIRAYYPDRKAWYKINAAYSLGGPGYTVNIINYNFKLDIQKYVVIDFSGFKNVVDAIGGINMTITKKEAQQISTLSTKEAGTYHLDGTQALAYARIRHIDSDFNRVKRQRKVILEVFKEFKQMAILNQTALANTCLDYVKTNISTSEIISDVLKYSSKISGDDIDEYTVPSYGMYTSVSRPVYYIHLSWYKQVNALYNFIYGKNVAYFTAPTDPTTATHKSSPSTSANSSASCDSSSTQTAQDPPAATENTAETTDAALN